MAKELSELEKIMNEEVEKRVKVMEQPDYEWPEPMSKGSMGIAFVVIAVCAVMQIISYFSF